MRPEFIALFFPAVFLVLGGCAIAAALKQQRKAREQLAGLARRFGLELRRQPSRFGFEPLPTLEGRYRNRAVRFYTYTTGSGKNSTTWGAVSAAVAGAGGLTLELFPENFLVRIATALGMQDIRVGDPAFDQAFIVKSNDPAYAAAALLPEIRARLLAERARGAHGRLSIKGGTVQYAEVGGFGNEARVNRLADLLEAVCDLAEVAEVYKA
ncbi:MAG: hypothetical protein PHE83_04455 [Opitutaceae bacterium]|nr:hypothetical protein [Opitutaceae bacterium]